MVAWVEGVEMIQGKKVAWIYSSGEFNSFVASLIKESGADVYNPMRLDPSKKVFRLFIGATLVTGLFKNASFDFKHFNPKNYDLIIFKKNLPISFFIKCLLKKDTGKTKFIGWYENPNYSISDKFTIVDKRVFYSSFDQGDCKKYGLLFNNSFLFYGLSGHLPDYPKKYDVIFVGQDKGRKEKVMQILNALSTYGLSTKAFFPKKNQLLPYQQYLSLVKQSRALLDITQDGQNSPTLRTLEGGLLGTKVITDNKNSVSQSFYKENNVLWINGDINQVVPLILAFLKLPFTPLTKEEVGRFDFSIWVTKFFPLLDGDSTIS